MQIVQAGVYWRRSKTVKEIVPDSAICTAARQPSVVSKSRRSLPCVPVVPFLASLALGVSLLTSNAQPKQPVKEMDKKIVPVIVLAPGESRELVMSTECTVSLQRNTGLSIKSMGDGVASEDKVWKKAGLTIEVPDVYEGEGLAKSAVYAPLEEKGIHAFVVKVNAAADAKTGLVEFHLFDATCAGKCSTDFRVLVVPKK